VLQDDEPVQDDATAQPETDDEVVAEVVIEPAQGDSSGSESAVNLPPEIAPIDDIRVVAGERVELTLVPTDPEGIVPSLYLESAPAGVEFPDNGAGGRILIWQTDANRIGVHAVTVVTVDAQDNTLSDTASFEITVQPLPDSESASESDTNAPTADPVAEPVPVEESADDAPVVAPVVAAQNLAPTIAPIPDQIVRVGQSLRMLVLPLDPEGIVPALNVEGMPASASFADNFNGTRTVLWQPEERDIGDIELIFRATDALDSSLSTSLSVRLQVVAADSDLSTEDAVVVFSGNQSPFFRPLATQQIQAGGRLEFDVIPVDPEGKAPTLHVRNAPADVTFEDNGNGTRKLVWQTNAADVGVYQFQFVAIDHDDSSLSVTQIVEINVVP